MRILGIVPYCFLPAKIGGQKAVEQLYRSLGRRVPVSVISTAANQLDSAKHFVVTPVFNNYFSRYANFFYLRQIGKIITKKKITHLITDHPYMGWMALYLKRKHRLPLAIRSHNIESIRFKSIGKKWWKMLWYYERYVYRSADFVFFMTAADRSYAIGKYGVAAQKAFIAPYGTEVKKPPLPDERMAAKQKVCEALKINTGNTLLLFNGSFDYRPNADALQILVDKIVPLLNENSFTYRLLICGRNISPAIKLRQPENIIFLDYVDDIFLYNLAADVFVNPVTEGGGIKTKLVEALAAGANAVSASSGAIGVDASLCNEKLYISGDDDWQLFTQNIYNAALNKRNITNEFYQWFSIDNIAGNMIEIMSRTSRYSTL